MAPHHSSVNHVGICFGFPITPLAPSSSCSYMVPHLLFFFFLPFGGHPSGGQTALRAGISRGNTWSGDVKDFPVKHPESL